MDPVSETIRRCKGLVFACLMVCVFLVMSFSGSFSAKQADSESGYYQRLTNGFLAGHLYSKSEVPEGLINLPNPSDPIQSAPFRSYGYHDSILFNKHIYYYWGPGAVICVVLPLKVIGIVATETDIGRLSLLSIPLTTCLFLIGLIRRKILDPSKAILSLLILGLPFSGLFLASRIAIWESGVLFMAATGFVSICGFILQRIDGVPSKGFFQKAAVPICLFAAITTRPEAAFLMVFPLLQMSRDLRSKKLVIDDYWGVLLASTSGVALLLMYNKLRFGSFMDFGITHLLGGIDHSKLKFSSIEYIIPNLYYYLVRPFSITSTFPFLGFDSYKWPFAVNGTYLTSEPVVGILITLPVLLICGIRTKGNKHSHLKRTMVDLWVVGLALIVFLSYAIFGATQRYRLLFDLIVGVALVLRLSQIEFNRITKPLIYVLATATCLAATMGVAHGYYPDRVPQNSLIKTIQGLTSALDKQEEVKRNNGGSVATGCSSTLAKNGKDLMILGDNSSSLQQVYVLLGKTGWENTAPIISHGVPGSADILGLQWDGTFARVLFDNWGSTPMWSPYIALEPDTYHEFSMKSDILSRQVDIYIDGIDVFQETLTGGSLGPVSFGVNSLGASTVNPQVEAEWYSNFSNSDSECQPRSLFVNEFCLNQTLAIADQMLEPMMLTAQVDLSIIRPYGDSYVPIVSAGVPGSGDIVGLKIDKESIWIVHDHWGVAPSISRTKRLDSSDLETVNVEILASKNETRIYIDDVLVLRSEVGFTFPLQNIAFGKNAIESTLISDSSIYVLETDIYKCES
jgi:hypothetical protein